MRYLRKKIFFLCLSVFVFIGMMTAFSADLWLVVNKRLVKEKLPWSDIVALYSGKVIKASGLGELMALEQSRGSVNFRAFHRSLSGHKLSLVLPQMAGDQAVLAAVDQYPFMIGYVKTLSGLSTDDVVPLFHLNNAGKWRHNLFTNEGAEKHIGDSHLLTDKAIWRELSHSFHLVLPWRQPSVQRYIRYYTKRSSLYRRLFHDAHPYIRDVSAIVRRCRLPMEFVLLPYIESGYHPTAVSVAGAAGLWQLMPRTARKNGLTVGRLRDDRFSVIYATNAACSHIKSLYQSFYSWPLVAAAYNAGGGAVMRAQTRQYHQNKHVDFWSIRGRLSQETREYVSKWLALIYMMHRWSMMDNSLPKGGKELNLNPYGVVNSNSKLPASPNKTLHEVLRNVYSDR